MDNANVDNAAYQLWLAEQKLRHYPANDIIWAHYYMNKAALHNNKGEFVQAIDCCEIADRVIPKTKHLEIKAKLESLLGSVHLNMGSFVKAMEHIDEAVQLLKRTNKKEDLADALLSKGQILLRQGDWADAIKYFSNVLAIARCNDYPKIESAAYMKLGFVFRGHEFHYLAINHFRDAERIFRKQNYSYGIWKAMYERANTWLSIGKPEETIKLIEQIEPLCQEGDMMYHFTLKLRYAVHNWKEEFDKALNISFKLHNFFEKAQDKVGIADSLEMIGSVYYNLGQMDKALQYGEEAAMLASEIGDKLIEKTSNTLIMQARSFTA